MKLLYKSRSFNCILLTINKKHLLFLMIRTIICLIGLRLQVKTSCLDACLKTLIFNFIFMLKFMNWSAFEKFFILQDFYSFIFEENTFYGFLLLLSFYIHNLMTNKMFVLKVANSPPQPYILICWETKQADTDWRNDPRTREAT